MSSKLSILLKFVDKDSLYQKLRNWFDSNQSTTTSEMNIENYYDPRCVSDDDDCDDVTNDVADVGIKNQELLAAQSVPIITLCLDKIRQSLVCLTTNNLRIWPKISRLTVVGQQMFWWDVELRSINILAARYQLGRHPAFYHRLQSLRPGVFLSSVISYHKQINQPACTMGRSRLHIMISDKSF